MFLEYYGLREQPFGVTPDPRFLYFGEAHREALASLFYGIESGCGFLALIAQPGMGKTTLLFHLLEKLRRSAQTVFLFQTQCGSREMFRHLLNDLGIDSGEQDLAAMHESLNTVLLNNARKGRRVVLVIDEAQNLRDSVLETVRLLSDFETTQNKLLQIVLSGQPQLADNLSRPGLTQLRQRISVISRLNPLPRVETLVYMEYRLCKAGYAGPPLFSYAAADLIAATSKGIPRTINNLCFNALTLGFAKRQKQIDDATVAEIIADLDLEGLSDHQSAVPHLIDDSLSSFDGISPSNDLTYQDFHEAVRAAWGNGVPVKNEGTVAQDSQEDPGPNSTLRPIDTLFQMRLRTLGLATTSIELDKREEDLAVGLDSFAIPATSPSTSPDNGHAPDPGKQKKNQNEENSTSTAAGEVAGHRAEPLAPSQEIVQSEIKNAPSGGLPQPTQVAPSKSTDDMHSQSLAESNSLSAAVPGKSNIAQAWSRWNLRATWGTLSRTVQGAFKRGPISPAEGRVIRRGTIIAVVFALTAGSIVFGSHHREPMQPLLYGAPGAPTLGSQASMQPPAPSQSKPKSRVPSGKASSPRSKAQHNRENVGKQLQLPSPLIEADGDASSLRDAQNRAEEQQ